MWHRARPGLEEIGMEFYKTLEKMKNVVKHWKYRYILVFGKICVIKTWMFAKITHIESIVRDITKKKIEDIDKNTKKIYTIEIIQQK